MKSSKIFIGIDISKKKLDLYVKPLNVFKQFNNDIEGIKLLLEFVTPLKPNLILLESTGKLEENVSISLLENSLKVSTINAKRARDFAKACNLSKTDKIDAKMLSDFASIFFEKLSLSVLKSDTERELKNLSSRRNQLIKMQTQEKNRLRWVNDEFLQKSIEKTIEFLNDQISEIDSLIGNLVKKDDKLSETSKILQSFPGIGEVTSNKIISSLPELGSFSNKKISRLVGVAPINNDSGMFKGKRTIKGGRFNVRASLYMPTLSAIKNNSKIKIFYQKLVNKGKLKKVAIIACMHKMLHILNAMVNKKENWKNT